MSDLVLHEKLQYTVTVTQQANAELRVVTTARDLLIALIKCDLVKSVWERRSDISVNEWGIIARFSGLPMSEWPSWASAYITNPVDESLHTRIVHESFERSQRMIRESVSRHVQVYEIAHHVVGNSFTQDDRKCIEGFISGLIICKFDREFSNQIINLIGDENLEKPIECDVYICWRYDTVTNSHYFCFDLKKKEGFHHG